MITKLTPGWAGITLSRVSIPLLRCSLGIVFVWFGGLKIAGLSPVAELVGATVGLNPVWFVPMLGAFEVLLGLALLPSSPNRFVLAAMVIHLAGTFLVFVVQPQVAFQHGNGLALTTEGEFVLKNLVLIAAGLVVANPPEHARTR